MEAYASSVRHPGALIVLLAVGLGASHPVTLGVAVGVGTFVVLMTLFFALATVLHARQDNERPG